MFTEDEVLNLVIEYDVNGDGTIDFDEFMEMMKKQAEHQVNFFGSNDSSICSKDGPSDIKFSIQSGRTCKAGYPVSGRIFLLFGNPNTVLLVSYWWLYPT